MISRIELTNFMSHEHTVIEPEAGLTVLTGPNNCGKSAVVAALQILCSNESSTYVMRHGAKECSVKLETDEGHVIEWRRKNAPSYVIDGQVYDRLGRSGLPDELHTVLRLPKVDAGENIDFDVHFGMQKSPIFLLGSAAANAARFFASSSDAIRLLSMQRRHKENVGEAQRERNRLGAEAKRVSTALEILEPIVAVEKQVAAASELHREVLNRAAWIEAAEEGEAVLRARLATFGRYWAQAAALGPLPSPPEIAPTQPLQELVRALLAAARRRDSASSRAAAMRPLPPPPQMAPTAPLQGLIAARLTAADRWKRAAARAATLAPLPQPPSLSPTVPLETLIRETQGEQARQGSAAARSGALVAIQAPPELPDTAGLARLAAGIARSTRYHRCAAAESRALSRLAGPPLLFDIGPLVRLVERLASAATELSLLGRRSRALERVAESPRLHDESDLAATVAALASATRNVAHWERVSAALAAAAPAPEPADSGAVSEAIGRLEACAAKAGKCESARDAAAARLEEAAADLGAKAAGSLCPICGGPLDADRLIASAVTGLGWHDHG
jgi:hypothetical protein